MDSCISAARFNLFINIYFSLYDIYDCLSVIISMLSDYIINKEVSKKNGLKNKFNKKCIRIYRCIYLLYSDMSLYIRNLSVSSEATAQQ